MFHTWMSGYLIELNIPLDKKVLNNLCNYCTIKKIGKLNVKLSAKLKPDSKKLYISFFLRYLFYSS